jgi:hypothetical protein
METEGEGITRDTRNQRAKRSSEREGEIERERDDERQRKMSGRRGIDQIRWDGMGWDGRQQLLVVLLLVVVGKKSMLMFAYANQYSCDYCSK